MCECDCGHQPDDLASSEAYLPVEQRPMRMLPKRRRFAPPVLPEVQGGVAGQSVGAGAAQPEAEEESDGEDERVRPAPVMPSERRGDGEEHYGEKERSYEHYLAARGERDGVASDPGGAGAAESTKTTNSLDAAGEGSTVSESPPTSPESDMAAYFGEQKEGAEHFSLFGNEGRRISNSLRTASAFSPAGLYGGLGLATLHPSLAQPVHEHDHDHDHECDHDHGHVCEEDEDREFDGDEDSYGIVDRSRPPVEPIQGSQMGATALGLGGSNKKKRKVPGLHAVGGGMGDDDLSDTSGREAARTEYPPDHVPIKAPVNPPTTAKAALAKLRIRPPHISLCTVCFSSRRQRRKRFRHTIAKQHPLSLPRAPDFVPPAMPRDGPPPLPPGSGLKGSKALKAAMKAHREREKEKERVRKLFEHVKVPDLWNPDGMANPSPADVSRAIKGDLARRRAEGRSLPVKHDASAYPTPPGSSDEGEGESDPSYATHWTAGLPELDLFKYVEKPAATVEARWTALNDQKERLKAAKERAAKAREEEKERRKEKEEKERAEAAAAASADSAPVDPHAPAAVAPPTPSATPKRNLTSTASRQAPPPSTSRPALAPSPSHNAAPPPAAALPPPPVPPAPPKPKKKGRKKRSAHANAHNVHHRDNYIPSRLPSQTSIAPTANHDGSSTPLLTSWPASEEAIAAAGSYASTCGGGHFCGPDEALCLFCEYNLFFGEESKMLKAVRQRKNVLKVRRKAQERASKTTQGSSSTAAPAVASPEPIDGDEDVVEEEYSAPVELPTAA
ncbi:hypothetical protein JCM8547_001243 [Rhodosporidiobolus lusitaniae]